MGALRLTLGRENTEADVDYVVARLPEIVERIGETSRQGNKEKEVPSVVTVTLFPSLENET